MLEDMGNAVKIGETIIPAVNIQVEGVPGYLEHPDGGADWYGVYFEVMMETGEHLVVQQKWTPNMDDKIYVEFYLNHGPVYERSCKPDVIQLDSSWESFVTWFNQMRKFCFNILPQQLDDLLS